MPDRLRSLLHLVAKDWRYVRTWAALCWVTTATTWLSLGLGPRSALAGVHELLALVLPFVVLARLLQLDPPLGSTSFWATRPIDPTLLLASKLAVGLLAVLGPCLLLSVAPLALRGLALTPDDYALALGAVALRFLLLGWFVAVVAALARRLAETALLSAVFVLLLIVVVAVYRWAWPPPPRFHGESFWLVALPPLLGLQALGYLYLLYRTRRPWPGALALAFSSLAIVGVDRLWRWDLTGPRSVHQLDIITEREPRTDWPIRVQVVGRQLWWNDPGSDRSRPVTTTVQVEGAPAGVVLVQTGYQAERAGASGWVDARDHDLSWDPHPYLASRSIPRADWAALCPLAGPLGRTGEVEVFRVTGDAGWRDRALDRGLRGRLRFAVVRLVVTQRAPVRGGRLVAHGRSIHGRGGEDDGPPHLLLRTESLSAMPFAPGWELYRGGPFFFDPASGDCLVLGHRSNTPYTAGFLLPVSFSEATYGEWQFLNQGSPSSGPIPAGTEMALLDYESLGWLEVPFEWPGPDEPTSPAPAEVR